MFKPNSFTNNIGQVINPGDEIICVTVSTGRAEVRRGFFEGIVYADNGSVSTYRWSIKPGKRYEWQGEYDVYTYGDREYKYKKFVEVPDPDAKILMRSNYGLIYKI